MDWFEQLLNSGAIVAGTYGNIETAKANAKAQAAIAQAQMASADKYFAQSIISKTTANASGITSPNMILIIMIGVAALFVINQANK